MNKKASQGNGKVVIPNEIMTKIIRAIRDVTHGTVTLIIQDACVIQLERNEKIRLDQKADSGNGLIITPNAEKNLSRRIVEAVNSLKYGQVLIAIKGGKVVQIERTEKLRVSLQEGMYGDGI